MKSIKNNTGFIVTLSIIALGVMAYKNLSKEEVLVDISNETQPSVGSDVVELNAKLQSVELDTSFLSSEEYKDLQDFSSDLTDQPTGRRNPFNQIGSDSGQPFQ